MPSSTEAQTPPVRTGWKNLLRSRALRWGVTLALLAYALSRLSADQIAEIASWRSVVLLLASSGVLLIVVGLNTVRWLLVARICRVQMPSWRSFQWTMIGHFFNQIFPSSVGGDVVRGILAGRGINDMGGAFSSIALERIVGLVALLALIAIGQPLLIARLHDRSLSHLALAAILLSLCALVAAFVLATFVGNWRSGRLRSTTGRRFHRRRPETIGFLERDDFSSSYHRALTFCLARDLLRKPVPTFRDHALVSDHSAAVRAAMSGS
jgi:uncharacterized protein (TIRG00374 family)